MIKRKNLNFFCYLSRLYGNFIMEPELRNRLQLKNESSSTLEWQQKIGEK